MNLISKLRIKLGGEAAPVEQPASPTKALEALNHLPDAEKIKVLDYIQSAANLDPQHEPAKQ